MRVLGFDTATPATTVAFLADRGRVAESRHDPAPGERPGHATRLLDLVERVLAEAGATWADVDRLAVGVGPGSFTGLRIGVATARALAQSQDVELVGVGTLEALAAGVREGLPEAEAVVPVLDARRGEAFAAVVRGPSGASTAPRAVPPEGLAEVVAEAGAGALAVGDGAVRFRAHLEAAGAAVPADGHPLHAVSARHVCRLGAAAAPSDRRAVLPDYLRPPDAELAARARPRPQ